MVEFHLVQENGDFREDAVNVVMGVEVTEEMERACLHGFNVCLVHDEIMLESLIHAYQEENLDHNYKRDWRDVAKWMSYDTKPISTSKYNTWEEFISSEEACKFLEQDYELE